MSGLFLLLCAVGVAIQIVFIVVEKKNNFKAALVLKTTASLIFILSGIYCMASCPDVNRAKYVVAGLVMGGIGDFFLNLQFVVKKEKAQLMFIVGAVAFLTGHVLYFLSLLPYMKAVVLVSFLIAVVITGVTMAWVYSRNVIALGLKIFGVFYIGAVVFITVLAGVYYVQNPVSTASLIVAIGAALFTASDVVLIFNMFGEKKPWMRPANLLLYYAAQLIIASSLLFVM